jgi:photosystem II stability/assembly factor-like uncharacterized protein
MKFKLLFLIFFSVTVSLNAQWDTLSTGHNFLDFSAIDFYSSGSGMILGNDPTGAWLGEALYTTDGGNTWNRFIGTTRWNRYDLDFTPSGNVWIVGDSGSFVHKEFPLPVHIVTGFISNYPLLCCHAVNDSVFFTAGGNGVLYRTLDYGFHWDTLQSGTLENINDIYFENAAEGWIVANGGYIASTLDSGNTWTFANQPFWGFRDLNSLSFQGSTGMNPYVVGSNGAGMFSTDGGSNWFQYSTNTGSEIACIQFGTTNGGIMCGADGFVSRTSNGGGNWSTDAVPRAVDYHDVVFGSDSVAYICGDSGVVLKSTVDVSGIAEENSAVQMSAYPNPAHEQLFMELNTEVPATYIIRIVDVTGVEVYSTQYNASGGRQIVEIESFHELATGIYFVNISGEESSTTAKVVKQ